MPASLLKPFSIFFGIHLPVTSDSASMEEAVTCLPWEETSDAMRVPVILPSVFPTCGSTIGTAHSLFEESALTTDPMGLMVQPIVSDEVAASAIAAGLDFTDIDLGFLAASEFQELPGLDISGLTGFSLSAVSTGLVMESCNAPAPVCAAPIVKEEDAPLVSMDDITGRKRQSALSPSQQIVVDDAILCLPPSKFRELIADAPLSDDTIASLKRERRRALNRSYQQNSRNRQAAMAARNSEVMADFGDAVRGLAEMHFGDQPELPAFLGALAMLERERGVRRAL
jgi:hypothetical protein